MLEYIVDGIELQRLTHPQSQQKNCHTLEDVLRAFALGQLQKAVDQIGNDSHIQHVYGADQE